MPENQQPDSTRGLAIRLPYMRFHPERTLNLTDTFCFSVLGVTAPTLVKDLLDQLQPNVEVGLPHPTLDCSHMVRRAGDQLEIRRICHGSFSDWESVDRPAAVDWLLPCAESLVANKHAEAFIYLRNPTYAP